MFAVLLFRINDSVIRRQDIVLKTLNMR